MNVGNVGPHVFGDDRLGLYVITPANLPGRLEAIRSSQLGFTDVFLPRSATRLDLERVRAGGLFAHLWVAVDGRTVERFAADTLADVDRLRPGAVELNVELPSDPPLAPYLERAVALIRAARPSLRLRLNVAPRKAGFLPLERLRSDPHLYVAMQDYFGNMDARYSDADLMLELADAGVPAAKSAPCYGAFCSPAPGLARVVAVPLGWRLRRGVVFSDDLLADAGLL